MYLSSIPQFFQIQGLKYDASPCSSLPHPSPPLGLVPPPTSCCPGCNIPFCTLSLSHSLLETGARRLKTHSFSWDFHLFAPSSLPLLYVNISWAEGGGKARSLSVHSVCCLQWEAGVLFWGTAMSGDRRKLKIQRLYLNLVGFFSLESTCVLLKLKFNLKCQC